MLVRSAMGDGAISRERGGGPQQLRKNLARVLGVEPAQVPDGLIRASLASYARYWREAFRLPSMDLKKLGVRLGPCLWNTKYVDSGLEAGHGVILALPHSG